MNRFLCAAIGTFLALSLGLQCHWGVWGLVATILPCSVTGWILADWKEFVETIRRMMGSKTISALALNGLYISIGAAIVGLGAGALIVVDSALLYLLLTCLLAPTDFPAAAAHVWNTMTGSYVPLLVIVAAITIPLPAGKKIAKDPDYQIRNLGKIFLGAWPPILPFTLVYVIWGVIKFIRDMIKDLYLYTNSDRRRIAFSSIALGMTAGFAIGYYQELIMAGTIIGGSAAWIIGELQYRFVYQPLLAHGETKPK